MSIDFVVLPLFLFWRCRRFGWLVVRWLIRVVGGWMPPTSLSVMWTVSSSSLWSCWMCWRGRFSTWMRCRDGILLLKKSTSIFASGSSLTVMSSTCCCSLNGRKLLLEPPCVFSVTICQMMWFDVLEIPWHGKVRSSRVFSNVLCRTSCCFSGWAEIPTHLFSVVKSELSGHSVFCISKLRTRSCLRWLCFSGGLGWLAFWFLLGRVVVVMDIQTWGRVSYTRQVHGKIHVVSISAFHGMFCYVSSLLNWVIGANMVHLWPRWFLGFAWVFGETVQSCHSFPRASVWPVQFYCLLFPLTGWVLWM